MNDESVKATESQTSPGAVREKPESAEGHVHAPSRRMFVAGALSVASLFALGGAGKALAGQQVPMRPPGAQDEARLWGACIKCDRCRSVCPEGVIDVAHLEDGLVNARTPVMDFKKGYCTFCDGAYKCAEVCPTEAIRFGFDPACDKIGMAVVDSEECLLYRSGSGRCSKECIDACAYEALSIDDSGHLRVDVDACNGCGACEHACPSSSYGSYTGSSRRGINIEAWGGDAS